MTNGKVMNKEEVMKKEAMHKGTTKENEATDTNIGTDIGAKGAMSSKATIRVGAGSIVTTTGLDALAMFLRVTGTKMDAFEGTSMGTGGTNIAMFGESEASTTIIMGAEAAMFCDTSVREKYFGSIQCAMAIRSMSENADFAASLLTKQNEDGGENGSILTLNGLIIEQGNAAMKDYECGSRSKHGLQLETAGADGECGDVRENIKKCLDEADGEQYENILILAPDDLFHGELNVKVYSEQNVEEDEVNGNVIFDDEQSVEDGEMMYLAMTFDETYPAQKSEHKRMATTHLDKVSIGHSDILFTQYPAQMSEEMAVKDIKFLEAMSFGNLDAMIATNDPKQNEEYFEKMIFDSITMSHLQSPIEHLRHYFVIDRGKRFDSASGLMIFGVILYLALYFVLREFFIFYAIFCDIWYLFAYFMEKLSLQTEDFLSLRDHGNLFCCEMRIDEWIWTSNATACPPSNPAVRLTNSPIFEPSDLSDLSSSHKHSAQSNGKLIDVLKMKICNLLLLMEGNMPLKKLCICAGSTLANKEAVVAARDILACHDCTHDGNKLNVRIRGATVENSSGDEERFSSETMAAEELLQIGCDNLTMDPINDPTFEPTADPTTDPTNDPTIKPTDDPTTDPTAYPTFEPTSYPSLDPTNDPTFDPTMQPTHAPTMQPTHSLTMVPTHDPTLQPMHDSMSDLIMDSIAKTSDLIFVMGIWYLVIWFLGKIFYGFGCFDLVLFATANRTTNAERVSVLVESFCLSFEDGVDRDVDLRELNLMSDWKIFIDEINGSMSLDSRVAINPPHNEEICNADLSDFIYSKKQSDILSQKMNEDKCKDAISNEGEREEMVLNIGLFLCRDETAMREVFWYLIIFMCIGVMITCAWYVRE